MMSSLDAPRRGSFCFGVGRYDTVVVTLLVPRGLYGVGDLASDCTVRDGERVDLAERAWSLHFGLGVDRIAMIAVA